MTYKGRIRNGVIVLDAAIQLPEGAEVDIALTPPAQSTSTLYDRFADLIGSCSDLPADMAENHGHYLHGREKN